MPFVLVSPDGTPFNSRTGTAATGKEAREACEACEARILLEPRATFSNVSALCDNPPLGLCQ